MKKLFINTNRSGYSPEQCGSTMTVGDLIEFLQDLDEDTEIYLKHDNGYSYGTINEQDFEETEEDDIEDDYYE